MTPALQLDMCFDQSKSVPIAARALNWMHTKGGRMIMRDIYAIAAGFVSDFEKSGIPVSVDYIFHIERHRIKMVRSRAQKMGVKIEHHYGYALNNTYTPYVARRILQNKPEWTGLFELREVKNGNV